MTSVHRVTAITVAACCLVSTGAARAPSKGCLLRGAWELASMSVDGKDQPLSGYKGMKVLTGRHFAFVSQAARRDTLPLKTEVDTLRAYQIAGGAGTYAVSGNSYTENLDYFIIPSWVGTSFKATCRVEGDRWYHSFTDPSDTTKARGPVQHVTEIWRRVE